MPGLIALVGGNEFRPECEAMDRLLLSRIGARAKVVILPTAAARENPSLAAENGVRYFRRLGADAEAVMVVDEASTREKKWMEEIARADFIYFTGGDPVYLLDTIQDSPVWKAMWERWNSGGALAGSSAGAMMLGGRMHVPGNGWREGLGRVPGIAVLPHHARLASSWGAEKLRTSLPTEMTLVGIDEATALAGPPWEVMGAGKVAVYKKKEPEFYAHGQSVLL